MKEAPTQQRIRLAAAEDGVQLLRQNSGALFDKQGRMVRFGLANESPAMNKTYKSGDLVGITPIVVTQDMVGMTLGIFTSVECKRTGWTYKGDAHEIAQSRWAYWVKQHGGLAGFASSVASARQIWTP